MLIREYVDAVIKDKNKINEITNLHALTREVTGISYDSRKTKRGDIFFCKGRNFKSEYLQKACENGAVAGFYESPTNTEAVISDFPECVFVCVADVRRAMAVCSALHYGYPLKKLITVAVTGTKGKTTAVAQIKNVLSKTNGVKAAVLSEAVSENAPRLTTPESPDLHEAAYRSVKNGVTHLICEVSSQAMSEKRCYGIVFDYACFLNFGRDHVSPSEHTTEEDYFSAKASLFTQCKVCVLNADCKKTADVISLLKKSRTKTPITLFSFRDKTADFFATDPKITAEGCVFDVTDKAGDTQTLCVSTLGVFNAENALAAYSVCSLLGASKRSLFNGILSARAAGRGEVIESIDGKIKVIIDYAHNEMSFRALFEDVRARYGKDYGITAIFGCPGEKAQERRHQLPTVAEIYADRMIICEDDSGTESFEGIKNDILNAIKNKTSVSVIRDRGEAIRHALTNAFENNEKRVIVFAGKGRESKMRTKNGDIDCASDFELAGNAVSEYNARLSLGSLFSELSVQKGKLITVVAENGSDIAENLAFSVPLLLQNGVACVVVCIKEAAEGIKKACFGSGVVCEEVGSLSRGVVRGIADRGALAVSVSESELIRSGAEIAVALKADNLVYLTEHGGILLNGRISLPKLSLSSAELITLGNECAYLPEIVYAAKNGVKSCAVIDGREKSSLALHLSGANVLGSLLS